MNAVAPMTAAANVILLNTVTYSPIQSRYKPSVANLLLPPKSTCKQEVRQRASDRR